MILREFAVRAGWLLLVLVVLSLVVGHVLGQPILLGYVTSASMEPTIGEGDAFVAIPQPVSGEVEEGDVVVFEARELHGGGLTTHRVVDVTEEGYVTKGDANPFTDQDGPEPVVRDQQVVAEALQVGGTVVTIPLVGHAADLLVGAGEALRATLQSVSGAEVLEDSRGFGFVLIAAGLGFIGLAAWGGGRTTRSRSRERDRSVFDARVAVGGVALLVVLVATAAMVLPAGVQEFGVLADDQPREDPLEVEPGGTAEVGYEIDNAGPVPTVAVLEPRHDAVDVEPETLVVGGWSTAEVTARVSTPEETGLHYRTVGEHRYFAVLPPSLIVALHRVDPVLAVLAVDLVIGGLVALAGVALLGTGRIRLRSRRELPARVRLRRSIARWL